jgi:membrane protein
MIDEAKRSAERAGTWARARVPHAEALIEAFERERFTGGSLIAGGLAYRLFFWLVPFGLVLAAIAGFWVEDDPDGLEDAAREFGLTAVAARATSDAIEGGASTRWYFLTVGLVLVFWFGIGVVRALRVAHFLAWGERPERLARPFAAGALFTLGAAALIVVSTATAWLREQLGSYGLVITLLLVVVYAGIALWMMSLLPHSDAPWTALIPGAALLSVGVEGLHLFVALYLAPRLGRSSELYGSLGAATVILLWLYITARLVTSAAFLNATLWNRRRPAR